jgi:hypothetical protein
MVTEINWDALEDLEWQIYKLGHLDAAALPRKANWTDPDPPGPAPGWAEATEYFVDLSTPDPALSAPVLGPPPGGWKEAAEKFASGYKAEPEAKPQASETWQDANKIFTKNFKGGLTHD